MLDGSQYSSGEIEIAYSRWWPRNAAFSLMLLTSCMGGSRGVYQLAGSGGCLADGRIPGVSIKWPDPGVSIKWPDPGVSIKWPDPGGVYQMAGYWGVYQMAGSRGVYQMAGSRGIYKMAGSRGVSQMAGSRGSLSNGRIPWCPSNGRIPGVSIKWLGTPFISASVFSSSHNTFSRHREVMASCTCRTNEHTN